MEDRKEEESERKTSPERPIGLITQTATVLAVPCPPRSRHTFIYHTIAQSPITTRHEIIACSWLEQTRTPASLERVPGLHARAHTR